MDADWLHWETVRSVGYVLAAISSLYAGLRERADVTTHRSDTTGWPAFWFVVAGLLVAIGVGGALHVGDLVTDIGRRWARSEGWYGTRRGLQAALVGSVSVAWAIVVLTSIRRFTGQRRRYIPVAVVVFTTMCVNAVKLVSLHQADTMFYGRSIGGVRVMAVVEGVLIVITAVAALGHGSRRSRPDRGLSTVPDTSPSVTSSA